MKKNDLFTPDLLHQSDTTSSTFTCLQSGVYQVEGHIMLRGSEEVDPNYSVEQVNEDAKT